MKTVYENEMTMRAARDRYFAVNQFGADGGYDDAWVDFYVGPFSVPFPNTKGRARALAHHDAHHLLTGYDTDFTGEMEIGAWELGAGCKDFYAAWWLNLGGLGAGLFGAPRRTFRAFVRGRREQSTYGEDVATLLGMTVGEARARFTPCTTRPKATLTDVALFALTAVAALGVVAASIVLAGPLVPVGLFAKYVLKKGGKAAATATA
ncbi:MAG: hypothetical protein KIT84_24105 [Labilithrix sp.]|nr:hypothetical protein [Labilithrix sp.]MCW5814134.1 hypothetical protein [Labilithrix sp.]